jgi:hypothetical protein
MRSALIITLATALWPDTAEPATNSLLCACQGSCALRLARAAVSLLVNANRKHRHVIDARRPIQYGGGACNLLLRTVDGNVELLFHATPQTGAVLTRAQAVELAQALTVAVEGDEAAGPEPSRMSAPRLLVRQPADYWRAPSDVPDAVGSERVDKRRWRVVLAGHLAAVTGQQIVADPTLLVRGSVPQEGPRPPIARGITQVLGKLVMHTLTSLDAGITGATAQGHSIRGELMPAAEILSPITDPTGNDRGRPHPGLLRRWRRRLRTSRYARDYHGDGRSHRPTGHPGAAPRHNKVPLGNLSQPPSARY